MTDPASTVPAQGRRDCAQCGTELAPGALVCPACLTLVHAERLRWLAVRAEQFTTDGKLRDARATWEDALALLPRTSKQHEAIAARVAALATRITDASDLGDGTEARAEKVHGPFWKRWGAGIGAAALLLLTKGKFLLLGLTKLPTFLSMFAFFGVYWATFGWPLALGLVVSIYIHEMGHVAAIVRLGKKPSAPMFIPGLGAFVSYSKGISDPREDAYIGLAGPIWGAGAGLVAFAVAKWTGSGIWLAIAQLTGLLNLFNLLPVFGLDGSHGIKALDRLQRWGIVAAFALAFWLTGFKLIILLALVAGWRAFGRDAGPGDARTLANFVGLIGVLSWMASLRAL